MAVKLGRFTRLNSAFSSSVLIRVTASRSMLPRVAFSFCTYAHITRGVTDNFQTLALQHSADLQQGLRAIRQRMGIMLVEIIVPAHDRKLGWQEFNTAMVNKEISAAYLHILFLMRAGPSITSSIQLVLSSTSSPKVPRSRTRSYQRRTRCVKYAHAIAQEAVGHYTLVMRLNRMAT